MTKFPNHCDEGIDFSGIAVIRWYEVPHWRLEARDEYFWFRQRSRVDNLRHDSSVRNREPAAGLAPWPTPLSNPMPAPSPPSERHYRQGRQGDRDAVFAAVLGHGPRRNQPPVANVRSPEHFRIRIQDLFVKALLRHPELIALARHGSEVAAEQQEILRVRAAAQERDDGVIPVAEVHPLEAGVMKIHLVERRVGAVQPGQLPP